MGVEAVRARMRMVSALDTYRRADVEAEMPAWREWDESFFLWCEVLGLSAEQREEVRQALLVGRRDPDEVPRGTPPEDV